MAQLVVNRYAEALFELAKEENNVDGMEKDANLICVHLKNNLELINILKHPKVSSNVKIEILKNIFKQNVSDNIIGLLDLMITKNRGTLLIEVLEHFLVKIKEYKGITTAHITSAIVLSEEQIGNIKTILSKKLNKQVEVELMIDQTLIGGLCIKVDGLIIERSIKQQLQDIKKQMLAIRLA